MDEGTGRENLSLAKSNYRRSDDVFQMILYQLRYASLFYSGQKCVHHYIYGRQMCHHVWWTHVHRRALCALMAS